MNTVSGPLVAAIASWHLALCAAPDLSIDLGREASTLDRLTRHQRSSASKDEAAAVAGLTTLIRIALIKTAAAPCGNTRQLARKGRRLAAHRTRRSDDPVVPICSTRS